MAGISGNEEPRRLVCAPRNRVHACQLGPQFKPEIGEANRENNSPAAGHHNSLSAFSKLTRGRRTARRIVAAPPLIVPIDHLVEESKESQMFEGLHELVRSIAMNARYTGGSCSRSSNWWTSRARWWAWVASALVPGSL